MLKIIAAVAENGVIGRNNTTPWRLRDDLHWFKRITKGHPVVMGSNTFRSIVYELGQPLPERDNIVLTRCIPYERPNVTYVHEWEPILKMSQREDIFIIGGAQVYALALPHAEELYLTRVHAEVEGDTFFPEWNKDTWRLVWSMNHQADKRNEFDFTREIHRRIR